MVFLAGTQLYSGVVLADSAQDLLNEMQQRYESTNSQTPAQTNQNSLPPPPVSPPIGTNSPVIQPSVVLQSTQNKGNISKKQNNKNVGRVGVACTKTETPLIIETNVSAKLFFNGRYLTTTPVLGMWPFQTAPFQSGGPATWLSGSCNGTQPGR